MRESRTFAERTKVLKSDETIKNISLSMKEQIQR